MIKTFRIVLFTLLLSSGLAVLPAVAQADGCKAIDSSLQTYGASLPNLPRYCTIGPVIRKVMNIAFTLIGSVSLLFLIIGGFRYMTAGGSEEQATAGKKTIMYAILGLVVVILATTIVNIIVNLILYGKTF
jgi:hypothetical protein